MSFLKKQTGPPSFYVVNHYIPLSFSDGRKQLCPLNLEHISYRQKNKANQCLSTCTVPLSELIDYICVEYLQCFHYHTEHSRLQM